MVFSPDSKPLFKTTGEGCEDQVRALLESGLQKCVEQMDASEGSEADWCNFLTSNPVPIQLEKDK